MDVQRIAAFSDNGQGGNPAGVLLSEELPGAEEMQRIAAQVGYSETAFAEPMEGGFRVRYFAPEAEVPFCGHATIALGAALGQAHGEGEFTLVLNDATISVGAKKTEDGWTAALQSPPTHNHMAEPELVDQAKALFGLTSDDLDLAMDIQRIHAGADHLLIPLARQDALARMKYDFDQGAALMRAFSLVTINLIWRQSETVFHSRNPFAGHGVYEDPATGAAAAALAGYLRDTGRYTGEFEIIQGVDMGAPSRLWIKSDAVIGQSIRVSGATRSIAPNDA